MTNRKTQNSLQNTKQKAYEFHWQEFEYNKGVIRIRKSKDRKHNDQKKKDKRPNNDLQNIHIKLKIE